MGRQASGSKSVDGPDAKTGRGEQAPVTSKHVDKTARIPAKLEGSTAPRAAAVRALPERVQRVVLLVLEGRSYHEIAATIGTGQSNVRLLVSKAYELLGSQGLEGRVGRRRRMSSEQGTGPRE
jgi:DNA-directed RNA polymerase specialized sigma24 family protein